MTHRSALLVWLSLLSTPALAQSPTQATLRHDGVLLGSPSVDSSPVTVVLREGTVVTVLERADLPFFKVEYNGQQGYISEGYLDMRAPELVRQEMEAKRAEEEARRTAAETARREREEARLRAMAEKLENEMSRLNAIMAAASLTSEQLQSACLGQKTLADKLLPVRCGLWGVGKKSDVITDAEKSYLSWIGGDTGTMLLVSPGPSVVFSTKDLLTITDREVTAQVRIDKGDVQTFKAHTFQSQVTILASTAAKERLIKELLDANQVAVRVPDHRNAPHTVLLKFKPKNPDEKVRLESRVRRKAAVELWKGSREAYDGVMR